jgi:hypothetical protein
MKYIAHYVLRVIVREFLERAASGTLPARSASEEFDGAESYAIGSMTLYNGQRFRITVEELRP